MSERRKAWLREYLTRPDVKERRRRATKKYREKYRSSGKYRKWLVDYIARPDVRKRQEERMRMWILKPENRSKLAAAKRETNLKSKYGITSDGYERMMDLQNGLCAICHEVDRTGRRLAVDHDHDSNAVRGLLCMDCNLALGLLGDDDNRILRMADYIKRHKQILEE